MRPSLRDDLLSAYAAGVTSPGLSLLCATHLSLRPSLRNHVAAAEEIGGRLLLSEPTDDTPAMDFDRLLARIAEEETEEERPAPTQATSASRSVLPRPIVDAVGRDAAEIPWKFRLPGLSEYVLPGFDDEKVSLLRARPGVVIPHHTHEGLEATLVLSGALRDRSLEHRAGDIAFAGPNDNHHPEIVGDEICYCLAVTEGALRFTGRFSRALNWLAE